MSRAVTHTFDGGVLRAVISGNRESVSGDGSGEAVRTWDVIFSAATRHAARRVLVIDELVGPVSTIRSYAVGAWAPQLTARHQVLCALVVADDPARAKMLLGARMAGAKGYTIKIFAFEAEALSWLNETPSPHPVDPPPRIG